MDAVFADVMKQFHEDTLEYGHNKIRQDSPTEEVRPLTKKIPRVSTYYSVRPEHCRIAVLLLEDLGNLAAVIARPFLRLVYLWNVAVLRMSVSFVSFARTAVLVIPPRLHSTVWRPDVMVRAVARP